MVSTKEKLKQLRLAKEGIKIIDDDLYEKQREREILYTFINILLYLLIGIIIGVSL